MLSTAATGLLAGLALIVAIGAQNAFVLRQGIRHEHVLLVAAICTVSDMLLIAAGTAGVGVLVERAPLLLELLRWGGVLYLLWFAIQAFRSAARPGALAADGTVARTASSVAATTLALTWLNPHVYLDTVVMLGNLANQQGPGRWAFAVGAMVASAAWFHGLALGGRALAGPLSDPRTWRWVDVGVGVVMLVIAVRLALG